MSILSTATKTAATLAFALLASVSLAAETVVDLPSGVRGTLSVPDAGATGPAVVMLHGFGSSRDEVGGLFAQQAAALAAEGIASLRIDFRGYGESVGDMADTTLEGLVADAAEARAYLAGVDGVVEQLLGQGLASKLSARLGEGVVNGLMTVRVGIAAMRVVRPLPFEVVKQPMVKDFIPELANVLNAEKKG